jgi:hypothetical protein
LKNNAVSTFTMLSLATTSPGTVATDDRVTRFLNTITPNVVGTIADFAAFNWVFFESQTLTIHRFKSAAKGGDAVPKRMSAPGRGSRLTRQRDPLRGLEISGPSEPTHGLYNLCTQMVERNGVAYINPFKYLSRQQELTDAKPEKELQLDASKTSLVIKEQPITQEIVIAFDLALYQAMQSRALAMDLTNMATYEVMKWCLMHNFFERDRQAVYGWLKQGNETLFPDSFGVHLEVAKQRVNVICLDFTREDHQEPVTSGALSGKRLWVHCGAPCGTASKAQFKRFSKKHHGPPPLRSDRWPNGLLGVSDVNLLELRAVNRLYRFMTVLNLKLDKADITWNVENPWTSSR